MRVNKKFDELLKSALWECLEDITLLDCGICYHVTHATDRIPTNYEERQNYRVYVKVRLGQLFIHWKDYSGCYDFPIPAPKDYKMVDNNFHPAEVKFFETDGDDYITGEYGESRVQCVMYLLEELTKND